MKLKKTVVFDGRVCNPSQILDDSTTSYDLLGYGKYHYRTVTRQGGMDMIVETDFQLSPLDLEYYKEQGFVLVA